MASIEKKKKAAAKIPNYPGRKAAEALVTPFVTVWAKKSSARTVQRLLGYWVMRQHVTRQDIADLGWMSWRSTYDAEADFRTVFGCSVDEFDPASVPLHLGLVEVEPKEPAEG